MFALPAKNAFVPHCGCYVIKFKTPQDFFLSYGECKGDLSGCCLDCSVLVDRIGGFVFPGKERVI